MLKTREWAERTYESNPAYWLGIDLCVIPKQVAYMLPDRTKRTVLRAAREMKRIIMQEARRSWMGG